MINWRETPFVRLLLPFVAGIALALQLDDTHLASPWLPVVLLLFLFVAIRIKGWYRQRWIAGTGMSLFLALASYQLTWHHNELHRAGHFSRLGLSGESYAEGEVVEVPVHREDWVKIELRTHLAGQQKQGLNACTGNLLLYVARDSAAETIRYGDVLGFHGRLNAVEPAKNPHAFDYRQYLHFKNIHHQVFVREGKWELRERGQGNLFFRTATILRDRFLAVLQKYQPTLNEYAVGSALVLGYRDAIPEEVNTAYAQTGAVHVLAVSGLHVGIVFIILQFLLGKIKWQGKAWQVGRVLLILAGIWAFALVTGASPSVMRAAVMFSFLNVGQTLHRFANVYNTLAASAFCLLLYNPYWLASVSFQLSYLAVLGIVFFESKFRALWSPADKRVNNAWRLVCVSLGAQLMTLPLTLLYFQQFPTYFWLSSLVLVPLSGVVLGAGLGLLVLDATLPFLAVLLGKFLWGLLWFCNQSIFVIQQLPGAVVAGIWTGTAGAVLLYLALGSSMLAIRSRKFRWVLVSLSLLVLVSANYAFTEYRHFGKRQIVVYHVYKHTALDFLDRRKAISLTGNDLREKPLSFAAQNHRNACGIDEVETILLEDEAEHHTGQFFYKKGFVQFYQTRLAVVRRPIRAPEGSKIKVDYLVVRGSPNARLDMLTDAFEFKQIIFDASNKKWQVEKWLRECDSAGFDCYDVGTQGAWVLELP
jgi:competence protein ComEC